MAAIVTLTMNPALDIATATDHVVPAHKLRCDTPRYDPGGGEINVARAVHALGGDALAIFPAGGAAGEMIRHFLGQEGVAHRAIAIAGFTRESLAVEDRESGKQYRFILPGPEIGSADQERCLDELAAAAPGADFIVASGSLPLGVPEDFYGRVGDLANRLGKRLILDTSGTACKFRSFRQAISVQIGRRFRLKPTGRFGPKRHPVAAGFRCRLWRTAAAGQILSCSELSKQVLSSLLSSLVMVVVGCELRE